MLIVQLAVEDVLVEVDRLTVVVPELLKVTLFAALLEAARFTVRFALLFAVILKNRSSAEVGAAVATGVPVADVAQLPVALIELLSAAENYKLADSAF